ncbi:23S rRNA (cytosine1962-C5)-methyltransferase [Inhella inkyongensis]|uniref:23S rRNA (Cytosine1962-C5)-methyltransferase n=1 Tax=Inhella inkyongensis TaxID=392593 RepID=A0A840S7A9_9BURK|nr:class I SAM-dependent rRNA methyltransferase [Inhella inkyongensis]MBB5206355.1 23S rRNA (cytosine1962-C5)-methyltransferase [Inhella inkyongensis]
MKVIKLRDGKERSLLRRHPWVFEGSIAKGKADFGETVRVESASGEFLCWAAYSPSSSIKLRAWSWDEAERIDAEFFARRIAAALAYRQRLAVDSNGVRLVHGEADGLPGLIVDRYDDILVAQFLAAGTEQWKGVIADALLAATGCTRLFERSDSGVRQLEGLTPVKGWVRGEGNTEVILTESSWKLSLDVAEGHKTGYYLDQRDNRREFASWVRRLGAQEVLNCYSYTGGFSIAALAGGATDVTSVDSSAPALARASRHVELNGFDPAHHRALDADVNGTLRGFLKEGRQFDAIVLDPPKFAPSAAHADRASRAYKDINRLGLRLLKPGGLLCTYSCSGGVGPELFHKIVAGAGMDAGVDAYIVDRVGASADHPQTLCFPEGEYLKGLLVIKRG